MMVIILLYRQPHLLSGERDGHRPSHPSITHCDHNCEAYRMISQKVGKICEGRKIDDVRLVSKQRRAKLAFFFIRCVNPVTPCFFRRFSQAKDRLNRSYRDTLKVMNASKRYLMSSFISLAIPIPSEEPRNRIPCTHTLQTK